MKTKKSIAGIISGFIYLVFMLSTNYIFDDVNPFIYGMIGWACGSIYMSASCEIDGHKQHTN